LPEAERAFAAELPGGANLAWFGQRLALRTASDLAILGHTHTVVGGLGTSPVNYVNSGYVCVARPDAPGTEITFTQVDLEAATPMVMAVEGGTGTLRVVPARAPVMPSAILDPLHDYSCYARVVNRTDRALRLTRSRHDALSFWPVPPPARIPPHTRADIWLSDTLGPAGSGGRFTYSDGSRSLDFVLECPRWSSNVVSSPVPDYETKVDGKPWRRGGVDGSGFPVIARFSVGAARTAGIGPASRAPAAPARPSSSRESQFVVAARAILDRSGTPSERGIVLCSTHLTPYGTKPMVDPTTEPSRVSSRKRQLKNPPNHLLSPEVQTITVNGRTYDYVWIQPNLASLRPPATGGMLFLPAPGVRETTLVTFNVAGLDDDYKRRCSNAHHAEMQLVGFINAQSIPWRMSLSEIAIHNYSRQGPALGYSACNACLSDLASFLQALNSITRPAPVKASISWERLYKKNPSCRHPTDAANIDRLVRAGWDQPMGDRPPGTKWPAVPTPVPAP
jgi:hypothetical protein